MSGWQRRARLGLALFILALAGTLAVSLRRGAPPAPPPPALPKSEPNAVAESTSGRALRMLGGRRDTAVEHYDRMVQYADGRTRLTRPRFVVLHRHGKDYTITADTADLVGSAPDIDVTLAGSVVLTATDGLEVRADRAAYSNASAIVRAPGPVRFSRGGVRGRAVGLSYDRARDTLSLLDQVVVHADAGAGGEGAWSVTAGRARVARAGRTVEFAGGVRLVRNGETLVAAAMTARLAADGDRLARLELRGAARVEGRSGADGSLGGMQARDIDLQYATDGRTLERAVLQGGATVDLAGAAGAPGRRLSADTVDVALAPGGTVTGLLANGRVRLDVPAEGTGPARAIRADALRAQGAPGTGLSSAVFDGAVTFRESPRPPAAARVATAASLVMALEGGFGRIGSAHFGGGVRFQEEDLAAASREADYQVSAAALRLSGGGAADGRRPTVVDRQTAIEGDRIDVAFDDRTVEAAGSVRTETRARGAKPGTPGGQTPDRLPAMFEAGQPVHGAADRLVYDGRASTAVYSGSAGLWQDACSIRADRIEIDERTGSLVARGSVVSDMRLERAGAKPSAKDPPRSVAAAPELVYDDAARRLTYDKGARLDDAEGDLTADRIALFLAGEGRRLARLEADGRVALRTAGGRRATGERLVYLASAGQYDMQGTPVTLDDEMGKTTGNSLTFYRSAARIVVDGRERKRTQLQRDIKR